MNLLSEEMRRIVEEETGMTACEIIELHSVCPEERETFRVWRKPVTRGAVRLGGGLYLAKDGVSDQQSKSVALNSISGRIQRWIRSLM